MALVAEGYDNFMGGELSSVPVNELNPGQLALCENAIVTNRDKPGILVKRKGYASYWDESGTYTGPVLAVHNYFKSDGTEKVIFAVESGGNTQIRERTGATTSSLVHTFTGTGKRVSLLTSSTDFAILACQDNGSQRWDGTTVTAISDPADAQSGIMVLHDGRLWAKSKSDPNLIYFSGINNESDWTSQDNSGSLNMKMQSVVGMVTIGRAGLVVCDEHAINLIAGDGFQTYNIVELSNQVGCKSRDSMLSFGNFALFLSHEGVVAISESGMEKISLPVESVIDGWTDAVKKDTAAFRWREYYVLCYDSNADGDNDRALIFDTRHGVWVRATAHPFSGGTVANDQTVYVADDTTGKIYTYDSGTTDDGTDIAMTVETRGFDFGRFFARKTARRVYLQSNAPGSTTNLTVQLVMDGTNVGATQNYDLNKGEGDLAMVDAGSGNVVQLRLTNSGTSDAVELRTLMFLCDMRPAGETI